MYCKHQQFKDRCFQCKYESLQDQLADEKKRADEAEAVNKRFWSSMCDVYHYLYPGWAQDGTPEMMANNIIKRSPAIEGYKSDIVQLRELLEQAHATIGILGDWLSSDAPDTIKRYQKVQEKIDEVLKTSGKDHHQR